MSKLALYIHWPFCKSKCPYCDFNSHIRGAHDSDNYKDWLNGYINEMSLHDEFLHGKRFSSIFFGGGTPSLMPGQLVYELIQHLHRKYQFADDIEITLEANPTSVEIDKFAMFRDAGINRVSIGVQSFNDANLKFLGREHSAHSAAKAIELAQRHFNRYSFDLIYAAPHQTIDDWMIELEIAMNYISDHISLYQLTIEKGTKFYKQFLSGEIIEQPEAQLLAFYNFTNQFLRQMRIYPYEISNYASDRAARSAHNMSYWNYDSYIGIGPGAHSRVHYGNSGAGSRVCARVNHHLPSKWLAHATSDLSVAQSIHELTKPEIVHEILLMGLRLYDGVSLTKIKQITGSELQSFTDVNKLQQLLDRGVIVFENDRMRLGSQHLLVANSVIDYLLL